jgi:biotin operon repressor
MKDINVAEVFEKPVRRSELIRVLDCKSDREARKCIEQLREKGYNIVNDGDGRGYYLASDEETLKYAAMRRKRALAEFRAANLMMLRVSKKEGIKIPVRAHFRTIGNREDENIDQICLEV